MRINLKENLFSIVFLFFSRVKYNEVLMTRYDNNYYSRRAVSPSHSTRTNTTYNDDQFINLPDLSGLQQDEKQHILSVLLRDENLRNKHLSRFMYVRVV